MILRDINVSLRVTKYESLGNKYDSAGHKHKSVCNKYDSAGHKHNSACKTA